MRMEYYSNILLSGKQEIYYIASKETATYLQNSAATN